ncbi:hypothetical protein MCHI_000466 [Candidatus Magnetoovum chiemensis]|nr:hypothetical protein MCHI_000466 [Candidatus Magnetoovum chiemensis]
MVERYIYEDHAPVCQIEPCNVIEVEKRFVHKPRHVSYENYVEKDDALAAVLS